MQSVNVNGVDLEYEVTGAGEPVLLDQPASSRTASCRCSQNRRSPTATSSSATTSAAGSEAPTPRRR